MANQRSRSNVDRNCESLVEQFVSPIVDGNKRDFQESEKNILAAGFPTLGLSGKSAFLSKNVEHLQQVGGGNVLLDFIQSLPTIRGHIQPVLAAEEGAPLKLPATIEDAAAVVKTARTLVVEYDIMWKILSLPILEPLTEDKLNNVVTIIHTCLYISLSLVTASCILTINGSAAKSAAVAGATAALSCKDDSSSDDNDSFLIAEIVDISLEIYRRMMSVMKNSLRVGAQSCQNAHLFSCWLLFTGIKYILNLTPSKTSGHKSDDLKQGKQGFVTVFIPLVSHALKTLSSLLDDLKVESGSTGSGIRVEKLTSTSSGSFKHNKFGCYSAVQRIEMLMSNINVINLLFSVASVSYRKAGMLRQFKHHHQQQATQEQGPSLITTSSSSIGGHISDIDDECCFNSDDSSRDEDSEPILGQLFKEHERDDSRDQDNQRTKARSPTQYMLDSSDKREPHRHLSLTLQIFELFNSKFVCSEVESLRLYFKAMLTDPQIIILSNIIKDVDRENALFSTGFYLDFSRSFSSFVHNLIATETLSTNYQTQLLTQLGVYPSASSSAVWPLNIPPRTLSVLAQVLLLRQRNDNNELRSDSSAPCLFMWKNLIHHLKQRVIGTAKDFKEPESLDDLNVEHAQLLLFIFHNLKLLQRKNVLLITAQAIVEISHQINRPLKDYQIHAAGRILHFFEYMMKNLYEPPHALIEQIDNNLMKSHSLIPRHRDKDNNNKDSAFSQNKMFFSCRIIEENYNKHCLLNTEKSLLAPMKPRFYYLMNVDSSVNKDVPKLDGMALSFVLAGISEVLEYDVLYDALVELLAIGNQLDIANRHFSNVNNTRLSYFGVCATQYTFNVVWRLFLQMPPSARYLEEMATGDVVTESHKILHSIIWVPRISSNKWFYYWVRDALVKLAVNHPEIKPENLLKSVIKSAGSVAYNVQLLKHYVKNILDENNRTDVDVVAQSELPKLFDIFVLESLLAKTMVTLDTCFNVSDNFSSKRESDGCGSPPGTIQEAKQGAAELLPSTIKLINLYYSYIRWNVLHLVAQEDEQFLNTDLSRAYNCLLRVTSSKSSGKVSTFTLAASSFFPKTLTKVLDKWNMIQVENHGSSSWRNDFGSASIPSEVFISNIENYHYNSLSSFSVSESIPALQFSGSIKRVTSTLLKFSEEIFIWSLGSTSAFSNHHQSLLFDDFASVVIPLSLDATLDSFYGYCSQSIDAIWNSKESDDFLTSSSVECLRNLYDILLKYSRNVNEMILIEAVKFMECLLDSISGQIALEKFFCDADVNEMNENEEAEVYKDIVTLVKSASSENAGSAYATSVLKFLTKLFEQTEKNPDTISLVRLCTSLSRLSNSDVGVLQSWFNKILCTKEENGETNLVTDQENRMHLQSLTSYIVKESSPVDEDVAVAFLSALLPMANQVLSSSLEVTGFPDMMIIMATLAGAGSGLGHLSLIKSAVGLLENCKMYLSQKDVVEKLEKSVSTGRHQVMMESCCYLLSYLADVFEALKIFQNDANIVGRSSSPDAELGVTVTAEVDTDWLDDMCPDEDESTGEESDEDSFCNKLCTFTVTQKEFMNQHWYHCHTCKMVDGVGVCTVCARVCHKEHDVTYAKYGSFFCDCGAKTDGSCSALVKRLPVGNLPEQSSYRLPAYSHEAENGTSLTSNLRRRNSSPDRSNASDDTGKRKVNSETQRRHQTLARQLLPKKNEIVSFLTSRNVSGTVLELLEYITPAVITSCQRFSSAGCSIRARKELQELHREIKGLDNSDQLMVPTLGSQEGAFENVRLNFSGEQGQTIRQLIATNVIRRVAMCALTTPYGKRQHLAVSHEKGKITLLQLAALLKQADSSKRKLTLTRLVSAPIPFTALTLAANPCNEDFLAVCGLKDCHVLTFNQSGHVSGHIVLHPQLETSNHVIKAVWLPGTQTELALVTADFVKIYDLSVDVISPQYFFLLPSGKIHDVTFIFTDSGEKYVIIMSLMGYIYGQIMSEESTAKNGPFYVTTILEVKNPEVKETSGGFINIGGVSVYYSHTFQMLFFSYVNGKSFIAPLKEMTTELTNLFLIELKSSNGSPSNSNGAKSSTKDASVPQPLCQWSEVPGHPGLVLAMCQQSNNPVVFMIKPDTILVQKIKFLNIKAKITDMVALRHVTTPGDMRTTLILLCEDGSLRIYMASNETNYWLRPTANYSHLFPGSGLMSNVSSLKSLRKKKSRPLGVQSNLSAPVDFFEHCTPLNDIEFGGNDVLHIYNTQQLKNRLNTTGMYIASTKPAGFTLEVYNNDPSMVMVGARILLGAQDINKAPSCVDIFERSVRIYLTRSRWFDFPFTRDESLSADKKLTIFFGASGDSSNVTMVDSVKIYGKTKDSFSWPDDHNEFGTGAPSFMGQSAFDYSSVSCSYGHKLSSLDRLLSCSLEVLDGSFTVGSVGPNNEEKDSQKRKALEFSTNLLTLPFPVLVQKNIKYLLLTLHQNKSQYNNHRDAAILNYVIKSLVEANHDNELDGEAFYRLICVTRSIANSRPNNLIKFGDCLTAAMAVPNSSTSLSTDAVDIEMTTFSSNVKASSSQEMSMSQSCYEFSGQSSRADPQTSKPKQLTIIGTQRSVSFSDVPPKENIPNGASFMIYLSDAFWRLYDMRPSNPLLPTVAPRGLVHCDATVQALVEIVHSFTLVDVANIDIASELYLKLFLCKDPVISFGAKQALVRVLRPKIRKRKVFIPSPPHCETPSGAGPSTEPSKAASRSVSSTASDRPSQVVSQGSLEVFAHDNIASGAEQQFDLIENLDDVAGVAEGVEELIAGGGGQFAPLLDLPGDADDEAMVELAIALSLQDQQPPGGGIANLAASHRGQAAASGPQRVASLEERGQFSDTTASAAASDDEGSTAATDGSTLRTSPVINEPEHVADGVGSESGASGAESIIGEQVSGRSSAYGEEATISASKGPLIDSQEAGHETSDFDVFDGSSEKLHNIRILLLERLAHKLPELREIGGINCIPMMQVILMLTTDLDNDGEKAKNVLLLLLNSLMNEIHYNANDFSIMSKRTPNNEVKLIVMRLLSILMSRVKMSSTSFKVGSSHQETSSVPSMCSIITAQTLINANVVDHCFHILVSLLDYWKSCQHDVDNTNNSHSQQPQQSTATQASSAPLKPRSITTPPDMSPFFLKQYVKSHGDDVFESYPPLLTEMVLRLLYQMKKISSSVPNMKQVVFTPIWLEQLCEYMMIQFTPYVRKQVRKLLSFICGSKEKYRQIRDFHALESHMKEVKRICKSGGYIENPSYTGQALIITLSYDSTISLIEHLKACCEIASSRITNWQTFCNKDSSVLSFFTQVSFLLDEGVSPIVLQLLQLALCTATPSQSSKPADGGIKVPITILQGSTSVSPATEMDSNVETLNTVLARHFISQVDTKLLSQFIQCFLLETNSTSLRWQAHSLIYNLYKSFEGQQQEQVRLLEILWCLWSKVPNYGRKAAQFVDLLSYFTIKINTSEEKAHEYTEKALSVLRHQNQLLMNHPNSTVYNTLQSLVEFDGFYLESETCLVCNNPEVSYANMKLSSLKSDSRFTTTTHIVKLLGSHTITKVSLRISDIKRSKMVKTLNLYYNNRAVHSVVELKNKTNIWHKAKKCSLTPVQTEIKIEFTLPIVACNLMIEYADFYENIQASSETLQCPRCSASVAANPGVCGNCGENVFQCHKCRAINYDEKDPFLCNSCGFCKYAKFDYVLTAKPTCAVDPIENEEDRKKTVQTINTLLEKADRVYKTLISNKPTLEVLLLRIQEHGLMNKMMDDISMPSTTSSSNNVPSQSSGHVNRAIQQVAQKYCGDCKGAFDELSKIIQKVLASRRELVDYDNRQRERNANPAGIGQGATRRDSKVIASLSSASGRCYGCCSATTEHCITLLKALATVPKYLHILCNSGLLKELLSYNLRNGKVVIRQEVRQLLCTLTYDNRRATSELNNMIMEKIVASFKSKYGHRLELPSTVSHEIALLICSLEKEDNCWEQRLRCVMKLFLMGLSVENPSVLESITLPCLRLLTSLIKPEPPKSKKNKEKTVEQMATIRANGFNVYIDLNKWLSADPKHSFRSWKQRCQKKSNVVSEEEKSNHQSTRNAVLTERYGNRWKDKVLARKLLKAEISLSKTNWLQTVLFNRFSRTVRHYACHLVEALFQIPSRRKEIIDMLTSYLDELGEAGEFSHEFFDLYYSLIQQEDWKYYLAVKGVLVKLGNLITKEIEHLNELEETTLNSDLSEGIALKMLVELLSVLMDVRQIKQHYKSRLVAFVLNGYLSLRKLVVQRTKIIDEAQDTLLELLEEMTTGTESETASFMAVCVNAINKCKLDDLRTPVFIFERLCSIIYPEENDTSEFFINLEKDPQQEDFLQGRMLGNPYSSNDTGMGPLMRDIKNKICQDCELVALLEDDSGMELLVRNKIISLDLAVKDVYKKIWCIENNESDAMRVVYRMRGLMGDATEEFIQTLDSKNSHDIDNEVVYKMANVMSTCGGLQVMLQRLSVINNLSARCRPLLLVLLKLFGHCVNVRNNRQLLIEPSLNAIGVMLNILKVLITFEGSESLFGPSTTGKPTVLEQLLLIMEKILVEASNEPTENYDEFCRLTCGTKDDIEFLLNAISSPNVRGNNNIIQLVLRILPLMTDNDGEKNRTLLGHFKSHLNFNKFDYEHGPDDDFNIDCFCILVNGIQKNANGNRLKDFIVDNKVVADALEYLTIHAPAVKTAVLANSDIWREFTQRPALKYVLRILTGLASGHESTQTLLSAAESIPIVHGLEQVSSDSHVGSLAEILLEVLLQNPQVAEKIEFVRKQTREEKKRLAMGVRQKQLAELGMRANEKGQVTASTTKLRQVEDLGEEQGLVCNICREGYKFQPTKVIGIYTFTKKCNVEPFDLKPRKTFGYSTVTHFNVVHVDCHKQAVRVARGRDEWDCATLQNANTKCNGILPLWGSSVQESAFASALAMHNNYLQDSTGVRDVGYVSTIHDLKLLLLKFATEESFSVDSGGGGHQSNIHLIPYLIHMALYVINTTRSASRELKKVSEFLEMSPSKWIENSYDTEGPYYWLTMFAALNPPAVWSKSKIAFLQRLIVLSQARHLHPKGCVKLEDKSVQNYNIYKPAFMFFALIEGFYTILFKGVTIEGDVIDTWTTVLADYIRNNDVTLSENADKLLRYFEQDVLPSQSFAEYADVVGLLHEIPDPNNFITATLSMLPS